MARVHLIHGFNVRDGGEGSIGKLRPFFEDKGYEVILHDYGWVFLFLLRFKSKIAIERISIAVEDGDILVGHSHGCLICWGITQKGVKPGAVVCIQPSMRRDTLWPHDVPVLCLYNKRDWIVALGRMWGRFTSVLRPWRDRHGWGSAGRHGFTSKQKLVLSIESCQDWGSFSACWHSGIFKKPPILFWAQRIVAWVMRMTT